MTRPKGKALGPSGPGAGAWWDGELVPSLPDLSAHLMGVNVDAAAFHAWMRERLANYRVSCTARDGMAEKATVIRWLDRAAADVDRAIADGRLRRLPSWHAEPAVCYAAHKLGHEWRALLVRRDAATIAQCLTAAAAALRRQKAAVGRPGASARAILMRALDSRLRVAKVEKAAARRRIAWDILHACGVHVPPITDKDLKDRAYRRAAR